jgi:hypothetical protein
MAPPLEQQPHTSKLTSETTGRQKNRSNIPVENGHQYYKRSVLIPLVDSCMPGSTVGAIPGWFEQQSSVNSAFCCHRIAVMRPSAEVTFIH